MDKEDVKREKLKEEMLEDLEAEDNMRDRVVTITVEVTINTHDNQLALEEAIDFLNDEDNDVYDYHKLITVDGEELK